MLYSGLSQSPAEAIALSKQGRPKLFSNKNNVLYMTHFFNFLHEARNLFPTHGISMHEVLKRQRIILQGNDSDIHKHLPKVINESLIRLKELLGQSRVEAVSDEDSILS